jgi:hypothetical protein
VFDRQEALADIAITDWCCPNLKTALQGKAIHESHEAEDKCSCDSCDFVDRSYLSEGKHEKQLGYPSR